MSKNLVKVNKFYEHPYYVEYNSINTYFAETMPEVGGGILAGPAIDRLYKFEQLGMEPEEIKMLIEDYKDLINKKDEEINALKNQITNKKDVEIKALKGQIDGMNQTIDKLREENQTLKDDIAALQEINEKISGDNDLYRFKNEHLTKLVDKHCDNKRGLEGKIENLKLELDAKNKTIDKLREELKAIGYIKELEDTCWVVVCKKQEAQIDELEEENLKLKEELKQKSLFITTTPTNPYLDLGIALHESNEVRKLVDENEKLKTKLQKAQDHIVYWKQVAERNRSELNRELSSFELRNEDLMKMNDELAEKNKHLGDQLDALRRMHRAIYGAHPDQVKNMKDQIERLNKNNAERQKTIDDLTIRLYAARSANDILRVERDDLKERISSLERMAIKNLETENKDLKAKLETINNLSDLEQPHPDEINKLFP